MAGARSASRMRTAEPKDLFRSSRGRQEGWGAASRFAAVFLSMLAMGAVAKAPQAAAQPGPGRAEQQAAARIGLEQARNADCANPGFFAPLPKQVKAMLCLFDDERTNPLIESPGLDKSARLKAYDIYDYHYLSHTADNKPVFYHFPPDPSGVVENRAEILAYGTLESAAAQMINQAWMESPEHRPIIENESLNLVGIAAVRRGVQIVWVGHFEQVDPLALPAYQTG